MKVKTVELIKAENIDDFVKLGYFEKVAAYVNAESAPRKARAVDDVADGKADRALSLNRDLAKG